MDAGTISFTTGQITTIACSTIAAMGGVIAALIKIGVSHMEKRFKRVEIQQYNLTRSIFTLLTRLHPDKAAVVVEAMEDCFTSKPNGVGRGHSSSS